MLPRRLLTSARPASSPIAASPRAARARPFTTTRSRPLPRQSYEYRSFGGQRFAGNRFALLQAWTRRPTFKYEAGGLGALAGGFYVYNLEQVPVSGRRRFNIVSDAQERGTAEDLYQQTLREFGDRVLPPHDARVQQVQRIVDRLLPHSGLTGEWTVHVIDDPNEKNAFVIPGGKVFVFTGILPICGGEDGVAAVLGHEIAHNVAHHAAERMSQGLVVVAITYLISFLTGSTDPLSQVLLDFGFLRPGSRRQESEADYIGLMMMAESCYRPEAAIGMQTRLAQAAEHSVPQFLSTHPMGEHRIKKLKEWLPQALEKYNNSDCGQTAGFMEQFREARFN